MPNRAHRFGIVVFKLRNKHTNQWRLRGIHGMRRQGTGNREFLMAVGQGFEPWELLHSTVFKTAAFDHSATPPELRGRLYRGFFLGQAGKLLFLIEKSFFPKLLVNHPAIGLNSPQVYLVLCMTEVTLRAPKHNFTYPGA